MDRTARAEAQKQWNALACGELDGDKTTAEYYDAVERERFAQQAWTRSYFRYDQFAGKKVLEIGVGQGTDLMQFAKAGADCHGIDITHNHLSLTQMNFDVHGKTVDLREADATKIPFPDNYFDCVYSFGVVHHIPEIEEVLAEAKRVLKPGGILMIAVYHKWSGFHLVSQLLRGVVTGRLFRLGYDGLVATVETGADGVERKPYVRLYSLPGVRTLLRRAGFEARDASVHQFYAEHMIPDRLVKRLNNPLPLSGLLGWYVAAKAVKP